VVNKLNNTIYLSKKGDFDSLKNDYYSKKEYLDEIKKNVDEKTFSNKGKILLGYLGEPKYLITDDVFNKLNNTSFLSNEKSVFETLKNKFFSKQEYLDEIKKNVTSITVDNEKELLRYLDDPINNFNKVKVQRLFNKNLNLSSNDEKSNKSNKINFENGDLLSLHLKTAYINDFPENNVSPYFTELLSRKLGKATGEIAIIANAFEEIDGKEIDFTNTREGRVVFYSDDVLRKQFLNFNNMPIYGPITYNGAPFAFRISIFELDEFSEQGKKMIELLADAGSKAIPPASPILNILNSLGSTFYNNDQTDVEFRYTMILDPKGGSDTINHFSLEVGNYVLIRSENRENMIEWQKIFLDDNEGRLYKVNDYDEIEPYTDGSYLVVEINKNSSYLGVEIAQNNFISLLTSLKEKDIKNSENFNSTRDAIMNVALKKTQIVNFHKTKEKLITLNDNNINFLQRQNSARELFTIISDSFDSKGTPLGSKYDEKNKNKIILSYDQVEYLMKQLRDIAFNNKDKKGVKFDAYCCNYFTLSNITKIKDVIDKDSTKYNELLNLIAPIDL
jgi:hypothetical protein